MSLLKHIRAFFSRPSLKEEFKRMLEQDTEAETKAKRDNKYDVN